MLHYRLLPRYILRNDKVINFYCVIANKVKQSTTTILTQPFQSIRQQDKHSKNFIGIWIFNHSAATTFIKAQVIKSKLLFTLSSPHRPTLPLLQRAVSSAKKSLTARFGMELGGTSSLLARR